MNNFLLLFLSRKKVKSQFKEYLQFTTKIENLVNSVP